MNKNKILASILAAALTLSSISVVSSAQTPQTTESATGEAPMETLEISALSAGDSFVEGDLKYTELSDGTLEVTFNNKDFTKVEIPPTVNGKDVTSIGDNAFYARSSLTSVTIPNSITRIGKDAFYRCRKLSSITIPNSVTSIGDNSFENCTHLASVTIPNSVTSIGANAFSGCTSLTSATIPNSVKNIDRATFHGCKSLTSITIPNSVTGIGIRAFQYCTSLTSITIPDSVTNIGTYAFQGCTSLTSVTIPNSVTSISYSPFPDCTNLITIDVDSQNKNYCSVNGVLFNKDKTELVQYPAGKTAKSYTIPDSVTSIDNGAFSGCTSLTSVVIPGGVTSIDDGAFIACTSLTSVTIPDSVTSIGYHAFEGCTGLTSITIPNSVTSIDDGAFEGCTSLTSVTIPNSVTRINYGVFSRCASLANVYYAGTKSEWDKISIGNSNDPLKKATIHYNGSTDPVSGSVQIEILKPESGNIPDTSNVKVDISGDKKEQLEIGADGKLDLTKIGDGNYTFTFSANN